MKRARHTPKHVTAAQHRTAAFQMIVGMTDERFAKRGEVMDSLWRSFRIAPAEAAAMYEHQALLRRARA